LSKLLFVDTDQLAPHTSAVEDYAKAIYALERRTEGGTGYVSTNALADRLGVSAASASAMVKRLDGVGLVTHVPYRGVRLTPDGMRLALEVLRHHRLLETYLAVHLGVPWDRVHEEAEVLEHVLSDELAERMAAKLGHPTHDPHGDPIPTRDGHIDEGETDRLADLDVGAHGTFVRVSDSDPAMLRYLAEHGIAPGQAFRVTDRQPFGGPIFASFEGGEPQVLGGGLAEAMRVEVAE
jgi:DtxR family transcriptional regulator, Mn-dependent transcriptional regulator